jgi:hypothetical protein
VAPPRDRHQQIGVGVDLVHGQSAHALPVHDDLDLFADLAAS